MKALITGINGQDGSYLAEYLLKKGYEVHGTVRRSSLENATKMVNLKNIISKISLHSCSLNDNLSIYKLLLKIHPDECYHLAASSFVSYSFEEESSMIAANFTSTHYILSSIKEVCPACRFYFAGSSEIFGNPDTAPQNELTIFNPRSMYGISKLASYYVVKNYRDCHGIYACTGFAYNHESPRRAHSFVTRKITAGVAEIALGLSDKIELGNINSIRDWGYAPEYVDAMWRILHNPKGPEDYIVATGTAHTVRDLLDIAFSVIGAHFQDYIKINKDFFRPGEKVPLLGDASKIYNDLGWKSTAKFEDVVEEMVLNDLDLLKNDKRG